MRKDIHMSVVRERVFERVSSNQNQSNRKSQSGRTKVNVTRNQCELKVNISKRFKRKKTGLTKSRLVSVLCLIG